MADTGVLPGNIVTRIRKCYSMASVLHPCCSAAGLITWDESFSRSIHLAGLNLHVQALWFQMLESARIIAECLLPSGAI